jgi:hypothetical protein
MHKKIRPVIPPNCPPKVVEFLQVSLPSLYSVRLLLLIPPPPPPPQICWAENPSSRPTAARALESLDSVIPQNYLS